MIAIFDKPVTDAELDTFYGTDNAQDRQALAGVFMADARKLDANAICHWGGMINDWDRIKRPIVVGTPVPRRMQSLGEVMAVSLDYVTGPSMTEAMQLLLNVAFGSDLSNAQIHARALLERMANAWADHNT